MRVTRTDLVVAASCAVVGLVLVGLRAGEGPGWAPAGVEALAQLLAAGAVLLRRRAPVLVLVVCGGLSFVSPAIATLAAEHALGTEDRSAVRGAVATAGAALVAYPALLVSSAPLSPGAVWLALVLVVLAYLAGRLQRTRAQEAEQREHAAIGRERERLGRELHDVVAQRLSYIVIEAGLIGTTATDPEVVGLAGRVAGTGRSALAEMRAVLGALDGGATPSPPAAGPRTDLAVLVAQARAVDQPVDVDVPPDLRLDGVAGGTALRVIGEALTNAVRHAPGARTRVHAADEHGTLVVRVTNGPAARRPTGLSGGGHGLDALRRRVGLLGGRLEAGPDDGGWEVAAWLPSPTR
ncbi:sensor histidine kinase [Cellulomonas sp.]|uniref:sensor histidine kinase n=1 Tax=Cellulomonas sp. TaxID=40001 RepID=UPI002D73631D|nr:histidine kinase [Cellulomonas sp.]HYQ75800.1 histidine kinase [Cellulomonas sp.]